MLIFLWLLGIGLKAFAVIHVGWLIVLAWPLIPLAVLAVLALCGVAVGGALVGVGSLFNRRKRTNIRRY